MREGWSEVQLGDILERRAERLGDVEEPRILTVSEDDGLVDQFEHWGRRIATSNVSKYKIVEPNDVVYNVYLLWNGAIGQNLYRERGVTSPAYEVFKPVANVEPRYIGLLVSTKGMREAFDSISIGTIPRRRRAPWQDFLRLPVTLPPLDEQRRIVDLIESLDDAIEAAEALRYSLDDVLNAIASEASESSSMMAITDFADIQFGNAFRSEDFTEDGALLLRGDNIAPGRLRWEGAKRISTSDLSSKEYSYALVSGDLVLGMDRPVISSGVRVAVVSDDDTPSMLVQRVARLRFDDPGVANRVCAFWSSTQFAEALKQSQTGSHVPHLSAKQIKSWGLPAEIVSGPEGAVASDAFNTGASVSLQMERLRTLRSNLLAALLSGEHVIPPSYDEVVKEVTV